MPPDPFGTAALRAAVLATWTASPARFREDANAEEALSRGYADRVLVELAANAVDAARAAGVPARIRIAVREPADGSAAPELRLANTGAPLTAEGLVALASLRASAKRADLASVGHFGVGFTAVLAVTDAPRVISTSGGVRFSAIATAEAVAAQGDPELTAELELRRGVLPTLRLCWPAEDTDGPPDGYRTEVRLPLDRDIDPAELLRRWRSDVTDHLFWALPDLVEVAFDDHTVTRRNLPDHRVELVEVTADGTERVTGFTTVDAEGELPEQVLRGRPVEQQLRIGWRAGWVLPDQPLDGPAPLCAPTPTGELLTLPARLIGTFEVDETRQHLSDSAVDDYVLDKAVQSYLQLVGTVDLNRRWKLVPPTGFPAGPVDARLREQILAGWRAAPLLVTALGDAVTPDDAVTIPGIDQDTVAALGEALPGLLPAVTPTTAAAARALGVRELTVAEAVDALSALTRPPAFWRRIYRGLAGFDADALAGLPVPLADGRQLTGARGLLLPQAGAESLAIRAAAALPALRMVHPDACDPVLERLGAVPADPDALLASAALQQEIARCATDLNDGAIDPDELTGAAVAAAAGSVPPPDSVDGAVSPAALAALVLDLIGAGGRGEAAVLADLVLTDSEGEPWPAGGLLLPGSALRPLVAPDDLPTLHRHWLDRWPAEVLVAAGVREGLLVIAADDPRAEDLLPGLDDWLDEVRPVDPSAPGIADLDLIDDADWPAVLALIAADPPARAALLLGTADRPGYSAWWLRGRLTIDGRPAGGFRAPAATELDGLYPVLPIELDEAVAAAVGVPTDLRTAADSDPQLLLDRFCDPDLELPPTTVPALTARLAALIAERPELDLPSTVRTLAGTAADAGELAVPDGPWWAQLLTADRLVAPGPRPAATATAFELPLAAERFGATITDVPDAVEQQAPQELSDATTAANTVFPVDGSRVRLLPGLTVQPDGGTPVRVGWWPDGAGGFLADGSTAGLADALAYSAGRYGQRRLLLAALEGRLDRAVVEAAFE